MASYDSIINVEEWISDHYLTTDETKGNSFAKRVKARIKQWEDQAADTGTTTPVKRFQAVRGQLQAAFAKSAPAVHLVCQAFGFGAPTELAYERAAERITYRGWSGHAGTCIVLHAADDAQIDGLEDISAAPVAGGTAPEGKEPQTTRISALVGDLFLSHQPPEFIVVLAGTWVLIAERETWPLGRYLAVDLQLVVERNETKKAGEIERTTAIVARENLERAADGTTWWAETLAESREHAVKVSGDLRDAVRESVELLGNDVLNRHRAQGLPIDDIDGNELARQSLRYLYRILFLLFAEASPELGILPTGASEYVDGYGLDRLRDQILTPPVTEKSRNGTHLYASLQVLFQQINHGHRPEQTPGADEDAANQGLTFRNLDADLFKTAATSLIDAVQLSNEALTKVLENLLLSKQSAGKDRGFISYATLGVTELGQVYEGLMSFHGFIAQEDLYEVAPKGNPEKGSWVLPVHRAETVPADSFVTEVKDMDTGGTSKVRREHKRGSFVFRQSSRDRERSASFYTPQVLTEFTVSQAIEVLQEEGRIKKAEDILSLTICEPAIGSGAFAVEAVRQLAELYLDLAEKENDQQVDPEQRTLELQKVKAYIALHQVYGVDLNPTAVELAEISLWLDTMTGQFTAPWFGLHLRRGNSLIGAQRATYDAKQLKKKAWLNAVPRREPMANLAASIDGGHRDPKPAGRIHHFLLPSSTWGAAADAKDLKKLAKEEQKALKSWRSKVTVTPSKEQTKKLHNLSVRVEILFAFALTRMRIAEQQIRRDVDLWGRDNEFTSKNVTRGQIEQDLLHNQNGAYRRLRLAMDLWNAMTFWPLTQVPNVEDSEKPQLPSFDEYLNTLADVLGIEIAAKNENQTMLGSASTWEELNEWEDSDLGLAGARSIEQVLQRHPWVATAQQVAAEQGFFHWDLDFSAVFARGGFDLQVGNPPWVRPNVQLDELYSEIDPWFSLVQNPKQSEKEERRRQLFDNATAISVVATNAIDAVGTKAVLGNTADFPQLLGQTAELSRGFMEKTWTNMSGAGVISLIHPESHFTEKKAAPLRRGAYLRLRRHWQFINELKLFDVHNLVQYGVQVYGPLRNTPDFHQATSLYHPQTVADSLAHDGSGKLPGLKDDDGNWDLRPHRDRIQQVDNDVLKTWHSILEDGDVAIIDTRIVYTVNTEAADVLKKLAAKPRLNKLRLYFSFGWNESEHKKQGYFDTGWAVPKSWSDVILRGPHLGVSTPMIKQPNSTLKNNKDWSEVDFETMPTDFIPATAYQPDREKRPTYDVDYKKWVHRGQTISSREFYRIAWRRMAAIAGFRTMYPAVIPPGTAHVDNVCTLAAIESMQDTLWVGAVLSSILSDFMLRATGASKLSFGNVQSLPNALGSKHEAHVIRNYLRLNCLTEAYAPLWEELTGEPWTPEVPLRRDEERRQAQNEIDAIVAISLGISADELCMIYRTQFPVMREADEEDRFDAHGRKVPKDIMKLESKLKEGGQLSETQRTWTHPQSEVEYTYQYPFRQLDREADLRTVYEKFS